MQKVIASKDVKIALTFEALTVPIVLATGSSVTVNVSGDTTSIGAIGTPDPISTDNGMTEYTLSVALQQAEAQAIKNALATATASSPDGSIAHMRQVVEGLSISIAWQKKRDVPATSDIETYLRCTGVSESDTVERGSAETIKTWEFRSLGMSRRSVPLTT